MQCQEFYINAQDTARLHVAATLLPNVKEERIFGAAGHYNFDTILAILRKHFPERTFAEDFAGGRNPNILKVQDRAEQLLRELGEPGWVSLEDSILANVEDLQITQ